MFLSSIVRRPDFAVPTDEMRFPWSLPLLQKLTELRFERPVTFLVGENGSGKSTLLEGIAALVDAVAMGSHDLTHDPSLAAARSFAAGFRHIRRRHARTRLFLRAEDVFGFAQRVLRDSQDLDTLRAEFGDNMPEGYGRALAMGVAGGQASALRQAYGDNPDGRSHGETFLEFLTQRMRAPGLYLLDEPETPLSPTRILALMHLIRDGVAQGSQFLIATHSPILMALPGAAIYEVSAEGVASVAYDEVEHVRITRAFLNNPRRYLD